MNVQEWLSVDSSEPGHTALTEEKIMQVVSRPDEEEDDELIAENPVVPSHSESYAFFSSCKRWMEAPADCSPASIQLLCQLYQNTATNLQPNDATVHNSVLLPAMQPIAV